MKEKIDKQNLLLWINTKELECNMTEYSKEVKEIHRGYMNMFRAHVRATKPENELSTLLDGIFIGIPIGIIIGVLIVTL